MKKILVQIQILRCLVLILLVFCTAQSYSQLQSVTVGEHLVPSIINGIPEGSINYRIYGHAVNPTDQIDRVVGGGGCDLEITSSTSFFIHPFMTSLDPISSNCNPLFFDTQTSLRYTSLLTIGTGAQGFLGVPDIDDTDGALHPDFGSVDGLLGGVSGQTNTILLAAIGEAWYPNFQEEGGDVIINTAAGGGWFSQGGTNTFGVGVDNSVLLGSFTTDGEFSYKIGVGTQESAGPIDYTSCDSNIPGLEYDSHTCSIIEACNYDPAPFMVNDDNCLYPEDPCNDDDSQTINDTYDENCNCLGDLLGCTNLEAINYDPLAVQDDGSCLFEVIFSVDMSDVLESYELVEVTGSFNGWCAGCTYMEPIGNSVYSITLELEEGEYEYRFMVDSWSFWENFEPGLECAAYYDDFSNRILTVDSNMDLGAVCWESCSECVKCSDETACNYSPDAEPEELNCLFPGDTCHDFNSLTINDVYDSECGCEGDLLGCTSSNACNFNQNADIDDGSCEFIASPCTYDGQFNGWWLSGCECVPVVNGVTFIDDNFNGVLDEGEITLPYQNIYIPELDLQIITDDQGEFTVHEIPDGSYTAEVTYTNPWTTYTTATTQTFTNIQQVGDYIYFGVNENNIPPPTACVDFYQSGWGVPCNAVLNYNICYRNMSTYTISGVIEVTLDPLLSFNSSYPAGAEVDGQVVTWEFENLDSWQMFFDDVVVNTPSEQHIGEWMTNSVTIYGWYEDELIPMVTRTIEQEVTCAYDPNDITGIPAGYTDDHLVMPDTRMEYLIRFQNTGNAPAGTVLVVDTLDQDMDFSTFQLMANSHSVMTTLEPSGRVEFLFENINLPDSTTNEPESHGLVSFKIDFKDDIDIGEEVNQTAYIFFDNNPPIVTNTTWHTVHECGGESEFELSENFICAGDEVSFSGQYPLVEDYQWNIDGEEVSTVEEYSTEFMEAGEYAVQLVAHNPLCMESSEQVLTVYDIPEAEITEAGATLTATEAESYQWFMNGEPLLGAVEQSLEVTEDGTYTVEVLNENGCSSLSQPVMIVSVEELQSLEFELYPNPMTDVSFLESNSSNAKTIQIINATGRVVREWENVFDQRITLHRESLATGSYTVTVNDGKRIYAKALIVR